MTSTQGVVTDADVHAAQTVLDALQDVALHTSTAEEYLLEARGVLAAWSADVRTAGYLEGLVRGRRDVGRAVRDVLEGEGA